MAPWIRAMESAPGLPCLGGTRTDDTGPDDEGVSGPLIVGGCVAELQPIGFQISATMAIVRSAWGWRAPGSVPMNHGAAMDLVEDPGLSSAL